MTVAGLSPYFEKSEIALAHLNRALAAFQRDSADAQRRLVVLPNRFLSTRAGRSVRETRVEDALIRFVSIADEFTLGLLIEVTEARLPVDTRVALLWERYEERYTDSWEQRFASWQGLHQVTVSSFPGYSALLGFIEARNAVIHGLGRLTRKQMKNEKRVLGKLNTVRIKTSGVQLQLRHDHALHCAQVVGELIEWLDTKAHAV